MSDRFRFRSMSSRALAVIPARLGSTRLPRKPLHLIAGRPLIEWVWRRVTAFPLFDCVVIATDSEEIAAHARAMGAVVELTSADHPSGTDRVAEVAARVPYQKYPFIVNIQGDEPFVEEAHLEGALRLVRDEGWDVGTVASKIANHEEWLSPSVVKIARGPDGRALYFSRSAIPHQRDREPGAEDFGSGAFLRHIGVYAYTSDALRRWVKLPEAPLEQLERLEQLRPLGAGFRIGVSLVGAAEAGVDTLDDANRAERRLLAV
ncbi:MAG: 3-deoxy-manno-octulosonate cytidylyltransferase [Gemmatimonadota bacterium]|nr:3-deoxy-manno-octulosonate cytidylyltransferase [Gemmatimonadota bacterium]